MLLKDEQGRPFKKHIADVRDIVQGCLCVLGKERAVGETFQLAGPRPFTGNEVSCRLVELLKIPHVEAQAGGSPDILRVRFEQSTELYQISPNYDVVRMIVDAMSYEIGEDVGSLPHG